MKYIPAEVFDKQAVEKNQVVFTIYPSLRSNRTLELKSVKYECLPGRRKIAVKVVDLFGNDTMKILEVTT